MMVFLDPLVGFALCSVSFRKLAVLAGHFLLHGLVGTATLILGHRSAMIPETLLITFRDARDSLTAKLQCKTRARGTRAPVLGWEIENRCWNGSGIGFA